jgi:hypothetical protein
VAAWFDHNASSLGAEFTRVFEYGSRS